MPTKKPRNVLFIMSDEHNRTFMGAAGHPVVKTPNLDRLAASGVRFTDAYCNSPICVPSRASFHTGRHVHEIRFWDNAISYDGSVKSWPHRLREAGHRVESIGKLHFRGGNNDNGPTVNGWSAEHMPMHVVEGIGDALGLLRDPPPPRKAALKMAKQAGRGESDYQTYDQNITEAADTWLRARAAEPDEKPWALFVSLVCPHPPFISRPEWFDRYPMAEVPMPRLYAPQERPMHPYVAALRECQIYDKGFSDESEIRRAIAAYMGMVSYVDSNVGHLMDVLAQTGLDADTLVIYTSDHGENLGNRGMWGKSNMYEESAGIPMIMAGPGVPEGVVCHDPVSLVDCHPTITEAVGLARHPDDLDLPGTSLAGIVDGTAPIRPVMSQYHAAGSITGAFMLRHGSFKYIYYAGMPAQLFDLAGDPGETRDLGQDDAYRGVRADCEAALRRILDPDATDALARADQAAVIASLGGKEAIIAKGGFGHSPTPGTKAVYAA